MDRDSFGGFSIALRLGQALQLQPFKSKREEVLSSFLAKYSTQGKDVLALLEALGLFYNDGGKPVLKSVDEVATHIAKTLGIKTLSARPGCPLTSDYASHGTLQLEQAVRLIRGYRKLLQAEAAGSSKAEAAATSGVTADLIMSVIKACTEHEFEMLCCIVQGGCRNVVIGLGTVEEFLAVISPAALETYKEEGNNLEVAITVACGEGSPRAALERDPTLNHEASDEVFDGVAIGKAGAGSPGRGVAPGSDDLLLRFRTHSVTPGRFPGASPSSVLRKTVEVEVEDVVAGEDDDAYCVKAFSGDLKVQAEGDDDEERPTKARRLEEDEASPARGRGGGRGGGARKKHPCMYGAKCTRKNPDHWVKYDHPPEHPRNGGKLVPSPVDATEVTEYHCMNKHLMTKLTSIPKGYEGYDCNVCDAALNKLSSTLFLYRCKKCDFDICMGCTHAHKEVDVTFNCDSCHNRFPTEVKRDEHRKACRGHSIQGGAGDDAPTAGGGGGGDASKPLDPKDQAINGVAPLRAMPPHEFVFVDGATGTHKMKNCGDGTYSCNCPVWRFQTRGTNARTCKHLREYNGEEFERTRCADEVYAGDGVAVGATAGGGAGGGVKKMAAVPAGKKIAMKGVLLANKATEGVGYDGYWVSEKLDGIRAFWDGSHLMTRNGNQIFAPDWFLACLPKDHQLDGELFGGRKKFQYTTGIYRSSPSHPGWKTLTYEVFDIPSLSDKPFEQRQQAMETMFAEDRDKDAAPSSRHVHVVTQTKCTGKAFLDEELKRVEALGGEGLMLRQAGSKYVFSRSSTLLKVKSTEEQEAKVIAYDAGKGRLAASVGALRCQLANGKQFSVGSGLNDAIRAKPPAIGSVVTVRYQELTDGGIPRFPVYVGVRHDIDWPPADGGARKTK